MARRSPLTVSDDRELSHDGLLDGRAERRASTTAAAIRRRSAPDACRSPGVRARSTARWPISAASTSSASAPTSAASAASARTGVAADAEQRDRRPADPAVVRPAHRTQRRRWRSRRGGGRPPRRRTPTRSPQTGKRMAMSTSSSASAVVQVPTKKSAAGTVRAPAGPAIVELGVEGERDGRVLGGRVGVGDRPADRAAVADLEVADQRRGRGQERHVAMSLPTSTSPGGPSHRPRRARSTRSSRRSDATRPMSTSVCEPGQPEVEHRDQALAAGEHLGLVAEFGEQRDDLVDGRRCVVVERCRLHDCPLRSPKLESEQ